VDTEQVVASTRVVKTDKLLEYDGDPEKWESYRALTPEIISALVQHTGLPAKFIGGLEDGDDWSFAIKIHSLIEWAFNKLVVDAIQDERLAKVISRARHALLGNRE
jgi:hypothetical protein